MKKEKEIKRKRKKGIKAKGKKGKRGKIYEENYKETGNVGPCS